MIICPLELKKLVNHMPKGPYKLQVLGQVHDLSVFDVILHPITSLLMSRGLYVALTDTIFRQYFIHIY